MHRCCHPCVRGNFYPGPYEYKTPEYPQVNALGGIGHDAFFIAVWRVEFLHFLSLRAPTS